MALNIQLRVPPAANGSLGSGQYQDALGGRNGEAIVSELHGKYYTQAYNGRMFVASITTASAIPLFATNPTPNFLVINPRSNPNNLVLTRINVGFAAGTGVAGQIGYAYVPGLSAADGLSASAAASAITLAPTLVKTAFFAQQYSGQVLFATAATLLGTTPYVPVVGRWSSFSQGAPLTSSPNMYNLYEDFDGTFIIPPGGNVFLTANAAIAETSMITLIGYEAPI